MLDWNNYRSELMLESDGNPVRGNMLIDAGYDLQQNHGG